VENEMLIGVLKKSAGLAFIVVSLAAAPALAMDNTLTQGGPDLTKARALIKAEDWAAAIKELKRLEIKGLNADVLNLLAFSQRKSGDFETAYKNYQRALKIDPNHKSAREYLGELYIQTGRIEEARAQLDILKRLCPEGCEEREDLEEALAEAAPK
jgi:Flp pilus assembly protein TadD